MIQCQKKRRNLFVCKTDHMQHLSIYFSHMQHLKQSPLCLKISGGQDKWTSNSQHILNFHLCIIISST